MTEQTVEITDQVERVLLPEIEVKLDSIGERVVVKPWGLRQGKLMLVRLQELMGRLKDQQALTADPAQMINVAFDEVVDLVRDSIGFDNEKMDRLSFEELIDLTQAIFETCLLREDGGGALGKLLTLTEAGQKMVEQLASPKAT
jgi:hypothetical protein